jgi:hypothetical protein
MDPAMLSILLGKLIPIIAVLAVFGFPVGILWVVKNHKFRMKELEIDAGHLPPTVEKRLQQVEARLVTIERALTSGQSSASSSSSADDLMQAPPDTSRTRTR